MQVNQFAAWSLCLGFVLSSSVTATAVCADGSAVAPGVGLKKSIGLTDTVAIATNVSDDAHAATIIFAGFDTSLSAATQSDHVRSRAVSLTVPMKGNKTATCLTQIVRGYVDLQGSSRATLVVRACGRTTAIDLAANEYVTPRKVERPKDATADASDDDDFGSKDRNFQFEIPGVIPAKGQYTLSLVLLVDRDQGGADHTALVAIDSLDIELTGSAPAN